MPQELDRIKHLAGLQQEAPAKKKLKYSSSQYAQALSQLQLRNHKGELHTITPKQQQKIIDIIEQHGFGVELQNYLHKINVINKYAAVSEAPAAGDQALAKDLANHFMNKANEFKKSGDTGPEYEEMVDIAKAFQQGQDQGMEEINDLANFEFSAHPFGGKFSNNEGEPEDEVLAILNKHGYSFTEKSHPERPNRGLVTLIKKDAKESTVQEAAIGLTAQQKQGLDAINAKYGKYIGYGNGGSLPVEAMERAIDPGSTLWADDKEENELKAYMKKMGYKDLSDMESKDEEYVDNVRLPISDAMADDLQKVLGDYNDNSGLAQAAKDYLGSLGETAVAEAPATESLPAPSSDEEHAEMLFKTHPEYSKKYKTVQNFMRSQDFRDHMDHLSYKAQEASAISINNSTMPTELNRIKELAGLQQEAAVSLKGKESALKAWYNKYSKYTGGNGDPLPFGLIKAYTESGIISDGYEENELAKAEKALGKKEGDWEDQDWQKVYSMTPITQGMERDLLTATGSKTVDEELLAKVYDVIEDMYPSYDQVLGKKESAVAEAPASGDQAKVQALLTWFTNKYNEYKQALINQEKENGNKNIQAYLDNNDELGELEDIISSLKTGNMQQAIDSINNAKFEFSGIPGDGDDFFQVLSKLGIPKKTFWFGESSAQPVNSSVDDTIQRARAQIETLESALKEDYKKFQGMKPYKPKKK